jgi:hypothetical protein
MHRTHFLSSLVLIAVFVAPVSAIAASKETSVSVRVYDKDHKDYHNWDDHENKQWGVYLSENHKKYHEYSKSNKKEQSNYWNWRHSHN